MKRSHELRIGMSAYWVDVWPETIEGLKGHHFSALKGRVAGWTGGTAAEALKEAREALTAREALENAVINQAVSS